MNFHSQWLGDDHSWHARVGLTGAYYFHGWLKRSLYVEGELNGVWFDGDREVSVWGFGVGYQIPSDRLLVWRVKIDWNRWVLDAVDDLANGFFGEPVAGRKVKYAS